MFHHFNPFCGIIIEIKLKGKHTIMANKFIRFTDIQCVCESMEMRLDSGAWSNGYVWLLLQLYSVGE